MASTSIIVQSTVETLLSTVNRFISRYYTLYAMRVDRLAHVGEAE